MAVAITPKLTALVFGSVTLSPDQMWLTICGVFIAAGILVSALIRAVINEFIGPDIGLFDRCAGALLGAVRIGLVAVLIVVVFDRIIPADRQPPFLAQSRLRPYLSAAGRMGLQSLPPEVLDYIDRLKRAHGISAMPAFNAALPKEMPHPAWRDAPSRT